MMMFNTGRTLLAASAIAGIAVLANSSPGQAASTDSCAIYAQNVAEDYAPPAYRRPIAGLIALPFDVTDALLTGRTRADFEWKRVYDRAYADCISGQRVAVVAGEPSTTVVVRRPHSAEWLEYCAAKYRSFNPETGTYITYSGEEVPCR